MGSCVRPGVAERIDGGSSRPCAASGAERRNKTAWAVNDSEIEWDAPVGEQEHCPGRAGLASTVRVLDIGAADKAPSPPLLLAVHGAADCRVDDSLPVDKLRAVSQRSASTEIFQRVGNLLEQKVFNSR